MAKKRLKVLVVDDSPTFACVMESLLTRARPDGIELRHELTARAGIAAIKESAFDCVFLDYMLADSNGKMQTEGAGLDLLRKVRSLGIDVPIVAVSGHGNEEIAVDALKLGAQDYLVKGALTSESVERALSNAIEKIRLTRQLVEKHQELEDFASIAAHDLRAPLRHITCCLRIVFDDWAEQLNPEIIAELQTVDLSARRMQRLLTSLLEFTQTGRSDATLGNVNLNEVVSTARLNLETDVQKTDAVVAVGRLPTIRGHEPSLVQLFQNLIANAIKFHRDRAPQVVIEALDDTDFTSVLVTDNGIGIDPQFHDRVFAPFRRLAARSEFEGSGMGLAICKRIVDQHGGEISIESQVGEYTSFVVKFPKLQGLELDDARKVGPLTVGPS